MKEWKLGKIIGYAETIKIITLNISSIIFTQVEFNYSIYINDINSNLRRGNASQPYDDIYTYRKWRFRNNLLQKSLVCHSNGLRATDIVCCCLLYLLPWRQYIASRVMGEDTPQTMGIILFPRKATWKTTPQQYIWRMNKIKTNFIFLPFHIHPSKHC